jgi:Protein of unknown function (DUF3500)
MTPSFDCPDCESGLDGPVSRRRFVQTAGATAAAVTTAASFAPLYARAKDDSGKSPPESYVKKLYESLSDAQKKEMCFGWDYKDKRGLLRTHVSNNWHITKKPIASKFYTRDQQDLIEAIFFGLYNKDWRDRILQQIKDDAGGYGKAQNIAIFGKPGSGKFEFVMTGRHLTIRCDGDSTENSAFGGPIFYGHAARGFNEKKDHPGNVFWHQALKANALYKMLDGKQRKAALIARAPQERNVHFRKTAAIPGLPYSEMSSDQQQHLQAVLRLLLEPYRATDQKEAMQCLKAQGGLDKCKLSFYQADPKGKSLDIGNDGVWDVWRLEGPAFVWYFRGSPHVHVWVNVASSPDVKISTAG